MVIEQAAILSLKITAVFVIFQTGMILGWFRISTANTLDWLFGKKISMYVQKPFWGCLPCMSLIWSIVFDVNVSFETILIVCGMNTIISKFLSYDD
jgi:hypothetical protein